MRFWTLAVLRGRVVTFGLEGRGTVAGAYFRGCSFRARITDAFHAASLKGLTLLRAADARGFDVLVCSRCLRGWRAPVETESRTCGLYRSALFVALWAFFVGTDAA